MSPPRLESSTLRARSSSGLCLPSGHSGATNIRVGRYITLEVPGTDPARVKADVDDMCRRLLANPIIEDYRFEIAPRGRKPEVTQGTGSSKKVRFGVVVFPGSNCDYDAVHALSTFPEADPYYLWHKDRDLKGAQCVILPGGFSYGDYLRTGAIARFSPIMQEVAAFAAGGGLVLGICNGFQTLDRGPSAARGPAAQPGSAVHLPSPVPAGGARPTPRSPAGCAWAR